MTENRQKLLALINDPTLKPIALSTQYINMCTAEFTSKVLGEGAFGKVYLGCDIVLGLQFAIKQIKLQIQDKSEMDIIKTSVQKEIAVRTVQVSQHHECIYTECLTKT
jgi:hypothetical protein